ncbi:MAG: TonB-dependent receptor [Acidobacteria bacterium]|nr:TonB-dependent receptor [Acidobacteriota bacterium]
MRTVRCVIGWACIAFASVVQAQTPAKLVVLVRSANEPVDEAVVIAGDQRAETGQDGRVELMVPVGAVLLIVTREGLIDARQDVTVPATGLEITVDLVALPDIDEEIVVVATTRTGRRIEDQPTRVEVLGREEIEEKMLMTPGDIVMMLNEMGGLRVQATSPSIGAASVRVQGMKGRYTRLLSDGLPLFGQQVGGLGLLQIPPMDLGQVEVIKGVASALYGAGAMGGVVNLLSRRPGSQDAVELLANQSTLGGTDGVAFLSTPVTSSWRLSLLGGAHRQIQNDRDGDGWADVAGYARGIVRPRLFWDGGNGRSAFLTVGITVEDRTGGTLPDATLAATGTAYVEALDTQRYDVGGTVQTLVDERYVLTARGAAAWQRHDHRFGEIRERDAHDTIFGEVALRGAAGRHTWVVGTVYERDTYTPTDVPRFGYTYHVPGVFAQDDLDLTSWLSASAGARLDWHSEYGAFLSPRLAGLIRAGAWTSRLSVGRGFFATTPLTEETEAAGLTRLQMQEPVRPEHGTSVSWDVTRPVGPVTLTVTAFGSRITDPVGVDRGTRYLLFNRDAATTNIGAELLGTARRGPWVGTGTYTYVRSREDGDSGRQDVALTPRHSAGFVGMWEVEDRGRVGLEVYYTGRQRLEVNPYRAESEPYVIVGMLVERRVGLARLFLNAENITNVRQTTWDSLLRSSRGIDGRWTVDAWAPVDGRAINGGVRLGF